MTAVVVLFTSIAVMCALLAAVFRIEVAGLALPGIRGRASGEPSATPAEHAELLLRDVLDESEYKQLANLGYLDVRSQEDEHRVYRVPAYGGLVLMYQDGVAEALLCVGPVEPLPRADVIAMHKLMIEGDENEYLRRARRHEPMQSNLCYRP